MLNIVEMISGDHHDSPCRFGNIVSGHACYCHHNNGPRKCPVWREFGESDMSKWHANGNWENDDNWDGGCHMFQPREAKP